jgi:hypothetical protein
MDEHKTEYSLIVTIVNRGYSDEVMDAAERPARRAAPSSIPAARAFMRRRPSSASPSSRKRNWC